MCLRMYSVSSAGPDRTPGQNAGWTHASTIAENGKKTCLKLKVFVRPSNNCVKTFGVHDRVFDVDDKVDNSLEPRDDTSHESAEPSRSDATNAAPHLRIASPLLAAVLLCLVALITL
ncbi:unnamed protein product [Gadus morhua 'NCC']